jgi:nitroreductase
MATTSTSAHASASSPERGARHGLDRQAAADAVAVAIHAPSILNTQPWQWHLNDGDLALRADRSRQLRAIDSDGHSLLLSCGAALHLASLALGASGWVTDIARAPDKADLDLLARLEVRGRRERDVEDRERVVAALQRRSERRPFADTAIAPQLIEHLTSVEEFDGVTVRIPRDCDEMIALAVAVDWAEQLEQNDPAFRAELAAWVRTGDGHQDGVLASAIPHVRAGHPRHTDVSVGDYALDAPARQRIATEVDERPILALIVTASDDVASRLRAGEAAMSMLITAQRHGLGSCIISQAFASVASRTRLRNELATGAYPQTMIRFGAMPSGTPAPPAPRRPVQDVLHLPGQSQ